MTFVGALGAGRLVLRITGVNLPSPWKQATAVLLGIQLLSLAVQILGMASIASHRALLGTLLGLWCVGVIEVARALRARKSMWRVPGNAGSNYWMAVALIGASLTVSLVVAIAPSTKFDELYYHMLVPGRIVHDGALHFYLLPWEGAALPQMGFQIAAAPLHAAGVPDAPNVVSWALAATMVWFAYRVVRDAGQSREWAAMWCAVISAGMYGVVWHVTGGPHAMGDLAIAALLVAVLVPESTGPPASDRDRALMLGVLASAGAMTKVSTLPLAAVLLAAGVARLCRRHPAREAMRVGVAAALPVTLLFAPLVIWTWHVSGGPLGPFFAWRFQNSAYAGMAIRDLMVRGESLKATDFLVRSSPLLWIGALCALSFAALPARRRYFAGAIVIGQGLLIVAWLTRDTRFLSGLPYGLATVFALAPPASARRPQKPFLIGAALMVLVVPWVALPLYYSRPFAGVVFGLESPDQFREQYVNFYADYRALDAVLPRDAILLTDQRMGASYAPRMPAWSVRDIPPGSRVYQFAETCESIDPSLVAADTVYFSKASKMNVFRTPGREAQFAPLCVRRLAPR